MSLLLALLALSSAGGLQAERKVEAEEAFLYEGPSRLRPVIRRLQPGEVLRVLSVDPPWARVESRGETGYVKESIFLPRPDTPGMAAQGMEVVRGEICWPPIEWHVFRSVDGLLAEAYRELDLLRSRSAWRRRPELQAERLRDFRREGRLAEFAPR